jgi:hypothetical protein
LVKIVAGRDAEQYFTEGMFRNSGEIHYWMYDQFSLKCLMELSGFVDINTCKANESRMPDFNSFSLDIVDGKIRKPDSLFIEGVKP